MATFNNVNEIDVANFALHKLVSIRISAVSADSVDLTNDFLGKHMQEFVTNFEEDGVLKSLKDFKHIECLRKASLLLNKVKGMMVVAAEEFLKDNSFDMKKAFAEIEEVFKRKVGVINALCNYVKDNPDTRLYYNKSALKARGWTDSMIRDFLEQPDIDVSPVCGFMGYRSFYLDTKVEAIEKTAEFKQRMELKNQRATAMGAGGAK